MEYEQWQYVQIGLSLALAVFVWVTIRRRQIAVDEVPFVWMVIAYAMASPLANLIHWSNGEYKAAGNVITYSDYDQATVWWCASLIVTVGAYLQWLRSEKRVRAAPESKTSTPNRSGAYIKALIVVAVLYMLNPFRGTDFGILNAQRLSDMRMGGLMVSGMIFIVFATLAVSLLRYAPLVGLLAILVATWVYVQGGSKGMGALYMLFAAAWVWRQRHERPWNRLAKPAVVGFLLLAAVALPAGVGVRGGGTVSLADSFKPAVGRFTFQEVASVVWSFPDWRISFAPAYVQNVLLGSIPGFLFPGKPLNPSYQITALYYGGVEVASSASPAFFGVILMVVQDWLYWPALMLVTFLVFKMDKFFFRSVRAGQVRFDGEWLYFTGLMALFEVNYVTFSYQIILAFTWHYLLNRKRKTPKLSKQGVTCQTTSLASHKAP